MEFFSKCTVQSRQARSTAKLALSKEVTTIESVFQSLLDTYCIAILDRRRLRIELKKKSFMRFVQLSILPHTR